MPRILKKGHGLLAASGGFVHAGSQPCLRTDLAAVTAVSMPQIAKDVSALHRIVPATLFLAVDPVAKRLVPVEGFVG